MAVITRYVIELQTDATGLREGLEHGGRLLREFGRDATRVVLPGDAMLRAGEIAASQMVSGLRNELIATKRNLAALAAESVIDDRQYRDAGARAAEAFNAGIKGAKQHLQDTGRLSANTEAILNRELLPEGFGASNKIAARNAAEQAAAAAAAARERERAHQKELVDLRKQQQALADVEASFAKAREIAAKQAADRRKAYLADAFDPRLGLRASPAAAAADALLKSATAARTASRNQNDIQLAAGKLNPAEYTRAGVEASAAFHKALTDGLKHIEGLEGFNEHIRTVIVDNFKLTGKLAGNALGQAIGGSASSSGNQFAREFIANATQANRVAAIARTMTLAVTAPIAAAGYKTVSVARDFEDAMLLLQSRTHVTQAELEILGSEAKRIGAETVFTGAEVARAQAQLATKGHFGISEVLKATEPVIQFAASQMIDLSAAVDIVATTMKQFGLTAGDTNRIVDVMAKGAELAGANVQDFQSALRYVGPVARASGLSIEETVAALALMSKGGRDASIAGTSLVGMLEALQDPTKRQESALLKNVDVYRKGTKEMRPFVEILGQLQKAAFSSGETLAQFGRRAGPGVDILVQAGATGFKEFQNALQNATGTVMQQANVRMSGLTGVMSELQGATENLGLAFANKNVIAGIRGIIGGVTTMLRAFAQIPPDFLTAITILLTLVAVFAPLTYAIFKVVAAVNIMRASMLLARTASAAAAEGAAIAEVSFLSVGAALATGTAVIAGLALLATAFYLAGKAARDAQADIDSYTLHLTHIGSKSQLAEEIISETQSLNEQKKILADRQATLNKTKFGISLPRIQAASDVRATQTQITLLKARIDAAQTALDRITKGETDAATAAAQVNTAINGIKPGDDRFPIDEVERAKKFHDTIAEAGRVTIELVNRMREQGDRSVRPFAMIAGEMQTIQKAFDALPDPFGKDAKEALKLLKVMDELEAAFQKPLLAKIKMQVTPTISQTVQSEADRLRPLSDVSRPEDPFTTTELGRLLPVLVAQTIEGVTRLAPQERQLQPLTLPPQAPILVQLNSRFQTALGGLSAKAFTLQEGFAGLAEQVAQTIPALGAFLSGASRLSGGLQAVFSAIANPEKLIDRNKETGDTSAFGTINNVLGVVSAVGAAVGTVQSVIGLLTADSEKMRAEQRANTDAVNRLRVQLEQDARGASLNVAARSAVTALQAAAARGEIRGGVGGGPADLNPTILGILQQTGISFAQLMSIADSFGITLLHNGQLTTSGLDDLAAALQITGESLGRFRATLDDQRTAQDLLQNVTDVEQTPQRKIQNGLDLMAKFSPQLAARFAGLDATTEAGRAAIKQALIGLVQTIVATGVTAEQLGTFANLSELLSVITSIEAGFDELADATNKVTDALTNVPQGFRVALRTFQATAITPDTGRQPLIPTPLTPPRTPIAGTPSAITAPTAIDNSINISGGVTIVASDGETSTEAMDRWVGVQRNKARGRGVPASMWPTVAGDA